MRADQILDAMQYLDDDLLEEASYFAASEETATKDPAASLSPLPPEEAERTPVSRSVRWVRLLAAAAVFVLLLAGVRFAVTRQPKSPDSTDGSAGITTETSTHKTDARTSRETEASGTAAEITERPASGTQPSGKTSEAASVRSDLPTTTARRTDTAEAAPTAAPPVRPGNTAAVSTTAPAVSDKTTGYDAADPATTQASPTEAPATLHTTETVTKRAEPKTTSPPKPTEPKTTSPPQSTAPSDLIPREESTKRGGGTEIADPDTSSNNGNSAEELSDPDENKTAFVDYCQKILQTEERLRGCRTEKKTAAELEALYGGNYLPTLFLYTAERPQPTVTPHGVYYEEGKTEPTVFNRYEYNWSGTWGGEYRVQLYVLKDDDGSYPTSALSALETYRDVHGVRVYFRCESEDDSVYSALAKRGDTVFLMKVQGPSSGAVVITLFDSAFAG